MGVKTCSCGERFEGGFLDLNCPSCNRADDQIRAIARLQRAQQAQHEEQIQLSEAAQREAEMAQRLEALNESYRERERECQAKRDELNSRWEHRECPSCFESIKVRAIKCRYCGEGSGDDQLVAYRAAVSEAAIALGLTDEVSYLGADMSWINHPVTIHADHRTEFERIAADRQVGLPTAVGLWVDATLREREAAAERSRRQEIIDRQKERERLVEEDHRRRVAGIQDEIVAGRCTDVPDEEMFAEALGSLSPEQQEEAHQRLCPGCDKYALGPPDPTAQGKAGCGGCLLLLIGFPVSAWLAQCATSDIGGENNRIMGTLLLCLLLWTVVLLPFVLFREYFRPRLVCRACGKAMA